MLAKAKAKGHPKAKAKSSTKSTDAVLERRRLKAERENVPEFDKILRNPANYVNLSADQIMEMSKPKGGLKQALDIPQVGEQAPVVSKKAFQMLPKEIRSLLSEDTLASAGISVEVLKLLAPFMSGTVLDKEELFFLVRLWRSLEASYWAGHIGGRVGLEISNSWDCLRSKICVDNLKASHMYVIVPVGQRSENARKEVNAPEYADRITIVTGYSSVVKLPNNAKVDFIVFEPPQNVQFGGFWRPEDILILENAKQRFLKDPRLPGAATVI
jgi:hypothetical protein